MALFWTWAALWLGCREWVARCRPARHIAFFRRLGGRPTTVPDGTSSTKHRWTDNTSSYRGWCHIALVWVPDHLCSWISPLRLSGWYLLASGRYFSSLIAASWAPLGFRRISTVRRVCCVCFGHGSSAGRTLSAASPAWFSFFSLGPFWSPAFASWQCAETSFSLLYWPSCRFVYFRTLGHPSRRVARHGPARVRAFGCY